MSRTPMTKDEFELAYRRVQDEGGHSYDPYDIRVSWDHYQRDPSSYAWVEVGRPVQPGESPMHDATTHELVVELTKRFQHTNGIDFLGSGALDTLLASIDSCRAEATRRNNLRQLFANIGVPFDVQDACVDLMLQTPSAAWRV